ncbi:hypothetical protein HK405_013219, partial [Cladochytrium tenue]
KHSADAASVTVSAVGRVNRNLDATTSFCKELVLKFGPDIALHPDVIECLVGLFKAFSVTALDLQMCWESHFLDPHYRKA